MSHPREDPGEALLGPSEGAIWGRYGVYPGSFGVIWGISGSEGVDFGYLQNLRGRFWPPPESEGSILGTSRI